MDGEADSGGCGVVAAREDGRRDSAGDAETGKRPWEPGENGHRRGCQDRQATIWHEAGQTTGSERKAREERLRAAVPGSRDGPCDQSTADPAVYTVVSHDRSPGRIAGRDWRFPQGIYGNLNAEEWRR